MIPPDSNRRGFLTLFTSFLLGLLGFCLAIPAVAYFCSPLRKRRRGVASQFTLVGPVADLPLGQWCLRSLETVRADGWKKESVKHAIWVHRQGPAKNDITVLSSICPHLGCPINWHTDKRHFQCPCHGGTFSTEGQRVAGPPPRPMDPLQYEVRGEHLWVRWQDFKIGTSERIPVNA